MRYSGLKQSSFSWSLESGRVQGKEHLCGLGLCPALLDLAVGFVFWFLFYHPQMTMMRVIRIDNNERD